MYINDKKKLLRGFGTWDTRSLTTHVRLPEGFAVNVSFKEYLHGQYLQEIQVGQNAQAGNARDGRARPEKVMVGLHAYDGSYTELTVHWEKVQYRIRSAHLDDDLVFAIDVLDNPTRFSPLCVLEGSVVWNRPGTVRRNGSGLEWESPDGGEMRLFLIQGSIVEDPYCRCRTPYIPVSLAGPVYAATGKEYSVAKIEAALTREREKQEKRAEAYADHAEAWEAMQTCLAWDEVYDPLKDRLVSNVSRIWNVIRGGYGMFCWDNFFAAMMIALDDPARGRMNAIEILNEKTDDGFVPNCSNAYGRKSFDRSQPPIGSLACREVYRCDPQKWFLEEVYPALLLWNEWWMKARMEKGLLCWGSNQYDNKWEMNSIHDTGGAALESGLDNSPMYDDIPFDPDKNIMCLWDVGLNSLYILDCECLADIASVLNDTGNEKKLRKRAQEFRESMKSLWDEEAGFYYNRSTVTGDFSRRSSPTNFYAAAGQVPSLDQYGRMIREHFLNEEEFAGEWMIPSIARNDPAYPDNNYWRGRIWAPMNFLVYIGMCKYPNVEGARTLLARKSEKLLLQEWRTERHIHENYNAETGDGDDVSNSDRFYHWGGLLSYMALIEAGHIPDFCRQIGGYPD